MAISRIQIAKNDIIKTFDEYSKGVFSHSDIEKIIFANRHLWRLALSTSTQDFINFLCEKAALKKIQFKFPQRAETRYIWRNQSIYTILMSLKKGCYFSHYTAMYLHNLTEQNPKTLYVNSEQQLKNFFTGELTQEGVNNAFSRAQRKTNNVAEYEGYKIFLLNGKYTNQLGVVDFEGPAGEKIRVTDIERTLIDIVVRPAYSGDVFEILKAFRLAKEQNKISINKLVSMLRKLNYTYPYHQAIGLYLERTGVYENNLIDLIRDFEIKHDFYLTHSMQEKEYSSRWKLFYPKGF